MSITARPYHDIQDLRAMQSILTAGRQADSPAYYIHPGDLSWWLFYSDEEQLQGKICLWEWNNSLAGWSLLSNTTSTFDVFVQPQLHGRAIEAKILLWAEEYHARVLTGLQHREIRTMWVSETDRERIQWLEMRGFVPSSQGMHALSRSLEGNLSAVSLPAGYRVRPVAGESEVRLRAAVSHAAFGSAKPFEAYWPRMLRFMRSPVYQPELDLVVVSPEGHFASFCLLWPDPVSRVGLFEPVGSHPDFRRQGLARAVMAAGLHRLKSLGMRQAIVCVDSDNAPALSLYQDIGFQKTSRLLIYQKQL